MLDKIKIASDIGTDIIEQSKGIFSYLFDSYIISVDYLHKAIDDHGSINDEDIEAAINHLMVKKYIKKIKNNKKIIQKAEKQFDLLIQKNMDLKCKKQKIDSEWLEYFFDMSSRVENEQVQEIWARLLLKEQLEPGAVRKVMLNTLSMMDSYTAQLFTNICSLKINVTIAEEQHTIPFVLYEDNIDNLTQNYKGNLEPFNNYKKLCPTSTEIDILTELGLLNNTNLTDSMYNIWFYEDSPVLFECNGYKKIVTASKSEEEGVYNVATSIADFTQIGLALSNALIVDPFEDLGVVLNCFLENDNEI